MTERISDEEFRAAEGVDAWRAEGETASARFATGSFAAGVALINRIGILADAANHHPDVDLRYPTVDVRLTTHDAGGLTRKDVELAREISAAARSLGIGTTED
jgi:pterin-4a-carbinolamine dehydratase